ncbi:MAG: ribosome maturation factor RimP [Clostridia bacterium]|nr:ribosome maturation factor RimP [Clostridia bacterium]
MAKGISIAERVEALVTPCITEMGYRVWDVEYVKEGAEWYLRITLDSDDGIDIEDCEKVSRAINPIIDEADPIEDFYYLEVSSPGLERVLRKEEHFLACMGSEIEIRLFAPDENKKKAYTGTLAAYENETVTVDLGGETLAIPMNKISKVQTLFDFSSIDMKEG